MHIGGIHVNKLLFGPGWVTQLVGSINIFKKNKLLFL